MLDQRTSDLLSKTPGAANIPILGNLFKSKNVNHSTTELIVVVTPTVVNPLTDTTAPVEPNLPIPTLNRGEFDDSLGKDRNPRPVVPPIDPAHPVSSNQAPAPAKPALSAPPAKAQGPATHAMVQVMTLSNKQDADAMVASLKRHGYEVAVNQDPKDKLLHLEVGPFARQSDAEAMRRRLVADGYNATIK